MFKKSNDNKIRQKIHTSQSSIKNQFRILDTRIQKRDMHKKANEFFSLLIQFDLFEF